jgi:hypothetical protein
MNRKIVEHPAVLEVRMVGRSKMKTVRTIFGHLGLLARLAWLRFRKRFAPAERDDVIRGQIALQGGVMLKKPGETDTPPPPRNIPRNEVPAKIPTTEKTQS